MSQENVETFKRVTEAYNRRDVEAMLRDLDPEIEWHPALLVPLGGEATVYRGHEGIRELVRDLDEHFAEFHAEYSEIRDLGDQVARNRPRSARVARQAELRPSRRLPSCNDLKNGKAIRVRTYLDPKEALEAAGLSE